MSNEQHAEFIASETKRMQKATKTTWIVGVVVVVFLSGYFSFILTMVRTFLEPEVAAIMVARNVKSNFPTYMEEAENMLAAQSVVMAEEMSDTIISVFPDIRIQAQAHLERTHKDIIPYMSHEFQGVIADYIRANREKIEMVASNNHSPEFTQMFVDDIMNQFGVLLNQAMAEEFDGKDLKYFLENSLMAMETMSDYLDLLIETDPENMSRTMKLHKQLLATITKRAIEGTAE